MIYDAIVIGGSYAGLSAAMQLGCGLEEGPIGPFVKVGFRGDTSDPGVFACDDIARGVGSVALAVGDGAMAGAAAHQSIIFEAA